MTGITNVDLLTVGISVAAIGILGFVVFFNAPKSILSRLFLAFSLVAIAWNSLNYLSNKPMSPQRGIWVVRGVIFSAVWYCYLVFQLLNLLPNEIPKFPKVNKFLLPITALISLLTLTPLVFKSVMLNPQGIPDQVTTNPGVAVFGIWVLTLIFGGITVLILKVRKQTPAIRIQVRYILVGTALTFSLYLVFNFILPSFFDNSSFISWGGIFTLPFIIGTVYSIYRHKLMNFKILTTEALTFALAIVLLLQIIFSTNTVSLIFNLSIFLLVLSVGILLTNSVIREVKQRELLQDLTSELSKANDRLKALDQARAEFISIASHQLRTPPATVKWYVSAILSGDYGSMPPAIADLLKKIEQTNNHLISLIEDMLNVSRIERGKMEFLFEPTDAEELARLAYEQLIPMSKDKKLALNYVPPVTPLPSIMADKQKLRQVMNNLIDNALKYTKVGSIEVKIFQDGDDIVFQVKDTGKGITPEDQEMIFQKYSRGKESIKQSAGLGLGLYVAKTIIDQHKGKIWAESPGKEKGSTFAFRLPIHNDLKATTLVDLA